MVKDRVEKGAFWLDQVKPNWSELVNPATVDVRDLDYCVVAQAFQCNYAEVCNAYPELAFGVFAYDHGFDYRSSERDVDEINKAWFIEIGKRRVNRRIENERKQDQPGA